MGLKRALRLGDCYRIGPVGFRLFRRRDEDGNSKGVRLEIVAPNSIKIERVTGEVFEKFKQQIKEYDDARIRD